MRQGVSLSDKKYVIALFIDIEGAFDSLWWLAILARLIKSECSSQLIIVINNLLIVYIYKYSYL